MSIKKIILTGIAAAAFLAPSLSAANAHHINKKSAPVADRHIDNLDIKRGTRANRRFEKFDNYDDYVVAKRRKFHPVHAGNLNTPGIIRRIDRQIDRIRAGRKHGDLTWRETRRLRKGIRKIRRNLIRARYDGHVSRYERRELRDMLNHNGKRIRRLRNNDKYALHHERKFKKYIGFAY